VGIPGPVAPLPVQQRKLEENSPAAKSVAVDEALQKLFEGQPNPAVVPQPAYSGRSRSAFRHDVDHDSGLKPISIPG